MGSSTRRFQPFTAAAMATTSFKSRLFMAVLLAAVAVSCDGFPQFPSSAAAAPDWFPVDGLDNLNIEWQEGTVYLLPVDLVEGSTAAAEPTTTSGRQKRSPIFFGGGGGYGGYYNSGYGSYSRPYYYGGGGRSFYGGGGYGGYGYNNGRLIRTAVVVGGAALGGA